MLDHDLTVRQVRSLASRINDGASAEEALREEGIELGRVELSLPAPAYREFRREASMGNATPSELLAELLAERYD